MGLRLTAAIPLIGSVVALALTIALLASGNSPGSANDNYWIAVSMETHDLPGSESNKRLVLIYEPQSSTCPASAATS